MSNLHKRVELLANIGIIVVAILLGVVLVNRYLLSAYTKPEAVEAVGIKPGMKLSVSGLDWNKSQKTLLLVLSTTCKYCTKASHSTSNSHSRKLDDGPSDWSRSCLRRSSRRKSISKSISVDQIMQSVPGAPYARATPTLIMVDRTGSVGDLWVGKLPPEKEIEVVRRLLGERSGT